MPTTPFNAPIPEPTLAQRAQAVRDHSAAAEAAKTPAQRPREADEGTMPRSHDGGVLPLDHPDGQKPDDPALVRSCRDSPPLSPEAAAAIDAHAADLAPSMRWLNEDFHIIRRVDRQVAATVRRRSRRSRTTGHRRAPRGRPVRRAGSRRRTGGTRAGPDDDPGGEGEGEQPPGVARSARRSLDRTVCPRRSGRAA